MLNDEEKINGKIMIDQIQNIPSVDSVNTEPFEGLVELYFQSKGYITSSNKWFWCWEKGKQQRGFMDIDLIAINSDEIIIVVITGNLDNKIRFDKEGNLRLDMLRNLFIKEIEFLKNVPQYSWLLEKKLKKIIAYVYGKSLKDRLLNNKNFLNSEIELISSDFMIDELIKYNTVGTGKFLKTNNSIMKMIQLFIKKTQNPEL